jgi:large subunit ribosomal protein L23
MSILNRLRKTDEKKSAAKSAKKAEKAVAKPTAKSGAVPVMNQRTLVRPIVTEKATVNGTYIFEVSLDATKNEVAKAIERVYGEKVLHVRMMRVEGKSVRNNTGNGKRKDWKKAIVRLPKGKTINVYEGV